jgi:exopolysaccharide biosynthesis polyprenyl glycosylphosphotransferase
MINEQFRFYRRVIFFVDLLIVALSFFIGYFIRNRIHHVSPNIFLEGGLIPFLRPLPFYLNFLPAFLIIWGVLLSYFGMYKSFYIRRIKEVLFIIFKTTFIGFLLFGSYIFILRMQEDISRMFIGFAFIIAAALLTAEKLTLRYIFKLIGKSGESFKGSLIIFRNILIVGSGKRVRRFIEMVKKNPEWGIRIVGLVDMDPSKKGEMIEGYKIIGAFDDIPDIIHKNVVDEVVFIVPRSWLDRIEEIMRFCESEGLTVNVAMDIFKLKFSKAKQTELHGFPLLTFETSPHKLEHLFIKRLIDILFSGIGILILSPLFVIIAIVIKLTSRGPVFFVQERYGLYGRRFKLYKFRTMVVDAEERLKELWKYNEMKGPVFKMSNDPRVTKVGKWLRRFSLDELPQLWNVLKGDMSLVGPRPPLPREVEHYDSWQRRRLSMRPGITCLWQTSGRSEIKDFNEWLRLDLEYIDNWSLGLDFKILLKTIPVVLLGVGAK